MLTIFHHCTSSSSSAKTFRQGSRKKLVNNSLKWWDPHLCSAGSSPWYRWKYCLQFGEDLCKNPFSHDIWKKCSSVTQLTFSQLIFPLWMLSNWFKSMSLVLSCLELCFTKHANPAKQGDTSLFSIFPNIWKIPAWMATLFVEEGLKRGNSWGHLQPKPF